MTHTISLLQSNSYDWFKSESALVQEINAEITEYLTSSYSDFEAVDDNSTFTEPIAKRYYSDYENCKWGFNFMNISAGDVGFNYQSICCGSLLDSGNGHFDWFSMTHRNGS